MTRCKKCPTILRSGNHTGYCSICEPPPSREGGMNTPFFPYAKEGEKKQWDRFLIKIRVEVARAFRVTIAELEDKTLMPTTPPHSAVFLILKRLFRIPDASIKQHIRMPATWWGMYQEAGLLLHDTDDDFRIKYALAYNALQSIGHDVLPGCADPADLYTQEEAREEFKPYVRFVRTIGKPSGSIRADVIS